MIDMTLGRRVAETQRLLSDLDTYDIEPRLKLLVRKALKTAVLADVTALTKENDTDHDSRQSN